MPALHIPLRRRLEAPYPTALLAALLMLCCSLSENAEAQDIHFSQYFLSPMSLNPAMIGDFGPEYRFAGNYRDQWRSVTDNPFTTFSIGAESNGQIGPKGLGTGVYIMNDQAGDGQLTNLTVDLGAAHSFSLNADSSATLRFGARIGFGQRTLDYTGLRFDQQYTGQVYDATLDPNEDLSGDKVTYANVHLGVRLRTTGSQGRSTEVGLAGFNLTAPDVSFRDDAAVPLDRRLTLHTEVVRPLGQKWHLMPSGQVMLQGEYREVVLGARFRHTWRDDDIGLRRAWIGGFGRLEDAAFLTLGVDYDAWTFGLSYDINFSSLQVASNNRGGIELGAIYLLDIFNETRKRHRACPAWI